MATAKQQSDLSMWNSKQVLRSGLFHSIRLVTVSSYHGDGEFAKAIQMQLKYLVKSTNGVSEGFYTDFCHSLSELQENLSFMFDISADSNPEKAGLYKQGSADLAEWVNDNSSSEDPDITPWMFTTIGS